MKPSFAIVLLMPTLVAVCGSPASAQEGQLTTASGPRVRITAPSIAKKPLIGTLTAIDDEKVTVQRSNEGKAVEIRRDALTRFEVSRTRSRKGAGAGIGAAMGAGIGAALGFASGQDCGAQNAPIVCVSRGAGAAIVGLAGAVVGSIVGATRAPGEKWEMADPDSLKVSVSLVGGRRGGGGGLVLSLRF